MSKFKVGNKVVYCGNKEGKDVTKSMLGLEGEIIFFASDLKFCSVKITKGNSEHLVNTSISPNVFNIKLLEKKNYTYGECLKKLEEQNNGI